jgi:probable HAF family extracellular repeat protein
MKTLYFTFAACLTLLIATSARAQHAFIWSSTTGMQDLGTLGGDISYAVGVNDSGQVVGYSYLADNVTTRAFIWTAAAGMVDLGTLPGGDSSEGYSINSAGEVAGAATNVHGEQVPAFWSSATGFVSLWKNRGDALSLAFSLNDVGAVTGQIYADSNVYAFIWIEKAPTLHPLPILPETLVMAGYDINFQGFVWSHREGTVGIGVVKGANDVLAHAINDNDEVAGIAYYTSSTSAFYWKRRLGFVTLQALGGTSAAAYDISPTGMIVGCSGVPAGVTHAAAWDNYQSAPHDLGTLPGGANSYALGVNSLGQVVGYSDVP